ncbi:glycerate kinase [Marinoscillum furvescens]|uniref:Glycerate kinase n=1 Tax=Marinoscillum furvescens DSM 4134 TaxID=1122208 RepID=A0A3D9LIG4_MARFU|nr:glycerate kinase [Marinoscillum furvescens]REE05645.1 glycerate kinase [Marinoscillum furvescens DSM 4134]
MPNVLICPNAFKSSLSAEAVAKAIAAGLEQSRLSCTCTTLAIADGGDGTLKVVAEYLGLQLRTLEVNGPLGKHVQASYGVKGDMALIELAEASGLHLLDENELDPWAATTLGTGQLIADAIDKGARKIYLTVGGSATVDGALGILDALGVVFYHELGSIQQPVPSDFGRIHRLDMREAADLLEGVALYVLSDVTNPLIGEKGAAAVFGPQKGAKPEDIEVLDAGLHHLADVIEKHNGVHIHDLSGAGAAGGVAGVLHGVLRAELINGAEQVLKWSGFRELLADADIVITAEGHMDEQTAFGKGPGMVAGLAKEAGKVVIGMAGGVSKDLTELEGFDAIFPVVHAPVSHFDAYAATADNLSRTARQIGNLLAKKS